MNINNVATLIVCLFFNGAVLAQPLYDDCANALDITEFFTGECGEITSVGMLTTIGSTASESDPIEPTCNSLIDCFVECYYDFFEDDADYFENSIWLKWTAPDITADGFNITYSIWTSDGNFNDDCGLSQPGLSNWDFDTQVAIYESDICPEDNTNECVYAVNDDLFDNPPWISGWLNIEFTPGKTYYMVIDIWDGLEGDFCLTIVPCGTSCGDVICAPVEEYCYCEDCRTDSEGNATCTFGNISPIEYADEGYLFADDLEGNLFFCSEWAKGYPGENVYLAFGVPEWTDCSGTTYKDIDVSLSAGQFVNGVSNNADGTVNIPTSRVLYIELTPTEIAAGSITISSSVPDGLDNFCEETLTINFDDFPQATNPYCALTCFAGGIEKSLLEDGLQVIQNDVFILATNGLEQLDLPCNNGNYTYGWRVLVDLYQNGEYSPVTSWFLIGPNPMVDATTFFVDEFGYVSPDFTAGSPISPIDPATAEPRLMQIQGAALCIDEEGRIQDGCLAANEGYDSSNIQVQYLPADYFGGSCLPPQAGAISCE